MVLSKTKYTVSLCERCVFILSHPDYNRRLWHLTRSADLDVSSARGLIQENPYIKVEYEWKTKHTAGGELRPALRIKIKYVASFVTNLNRAAI